ncbi:alanine racemase [Lactobacillus sp. UCMA15818]|uniref:alanine racemase n=1 Tax=Lactobacillus sp. UCMA15818 TaxID=2583394 RepID=UPI0025AFB5AA|nr:alanine racemase [Lactobacillus sp. UCMA15818]MDN2453881.1 alanine racemase [Lactobacillus sp. UCMA15818]
MVVGIHRKTYAKVDLSAIKHNIVVEKKQLANKQNIFAVVKANAYGHGIIEVAKAAHEVGVAGYCVAIIDEALALRKAGLNELILVLGVNPFEYASLMAKNNISATVGDIDFLKKAQVVLSTEKQQLSVHLALDTGMGRIGFRTQKELREAADFIKQHSTEFNFEGIFTHFSTADSGEKVAVDYYEKQIAEFNELISCLEELPEYVHVANSAASIWHKECGGNTIRFGITMYGLNPSSDELSIPSEFKPAISLLSEVAAIKKIKKNDSVGYGKTYTAKEDEWIATIPIGYADGWLRKMQGFKILIADHFCEIVGRVCMDQIMVKVPWKMAVGTTVILIGKKGQKEIRVQDVADQVGTIHYEVTCLISERVPRIY